MSINTVLSALALKKQEVISETLRLVEETRQADDNVQQELENLRVVQARVHDAQAVVHRLQEKRDNRADDVQSARGSRKQALALIAFHTSDAELEKAGADYFEIVAEFERVNAKVLVATAKRDALMTLCQKGQEEALWLQRVLEEY